MAQGSDRGLRALVSVSMMKAIARATHATIAGRTMIRARQPGPVSRVQASDVGPGT